MSKPMTEPTEAMIQAGRKSWVDAITDPEHDGDGGPVFAEMYRRMKALDPDTHRASSDEVGRLYTNLLMSVARKYEGESRHETALRYIKEREADLGEAIAAMSVQSDKGEG